MTRHCNFRSGLAAALLAGVLLACPLPAAEPSGDLISRIDPQRDAASGEWRQQGAELTVGAANGARLTLPVQPSGEYDFRVSFTRRSGRDSVALIFTARGGQATFELDAWGAHLAGIQNINGQSLRDNSSRVNNQQLENGRRYTAGVRVRRDRVEAVLDGKVLTTVRTEGASFSMLDLWQIPDSKSLGVGSWNSETVFHSIEIRGADGKPMTLAAASTPRPTPGNATPGNVTLKSASKTTSASSRTPGSSTPSRSAAGSSTNRVLIVIANQDFFYREYSDPRRELERAGIEVEVAAGSKSPCRPHQNSGEGSDGGVVQPDFAIADVDPSRYDALLFSGGWGSSMYQYAFEGSYSNRVYNGERAVKEATNRLINQFVAQDRIVAALCHGTSVLARSRVNGRSLLAGKQATGTTRQAPAGVYNGSPGQPVSRWNLEVNGARLVAPNAVGNRSTSTDDVVADGKILTGQEDNSAAEMGRQIAARLRGGR